MKKKQFILSLLLLTALCSCSDKEDSMTPALSVPVDAIDFKQEASSREVEVETNTDNWMAKVTGDAGWCTTTTSGKTLTVAVTTNDGKEIRTCNVIVSSGSLADTITVRQLGEEPALLISKQLFTVDAIGGSVQFDVTTNVDVDMTYPEWIRESPSTLRSTEMITTSYSFKVTGTTDDAERTGSIIVKDKGSDLKSEVVVTQKGLGNYESGSLEGIEDDIQVKPESGEASSYQSGSNIELSFDGDMSTIYHSSWNNAGENYFPITLTYNFPAGSDMDYFIYYPRTSGSNGHFKEVEIRVRSNANLRSADEWNTVLTKNFGGSGTATRVDFPQSQIGVTAVQFVVKSGSGDGQGFASCGEMTFHKKNPNAFDPSTLFTDMTCSELKPGITDEEIENCAYSFYKNIAYYLKAGKYPKEFRVQEYKAYPHPDDQAATHKTNPYSLLDNPTGISVKSGEQLMVFVGETNGQTVSMKIQDLDVPGGDGFGGSSYPLTKGANKITTSDKGLVYIMYHTSDYANVQPVKVHFASGRINGYFDIARHQASDWNRLLGNATDKYFDVVGKYAHLTFPTSRFRNYTPDGKALIDAYDKIVESEMQLMGLYKYDKTFKNRMYLNVMYTSYMYATAYHTAYNDETLPELCDVEKQKTSACWGPAHEIGHCNQTRPGLKWLGTTEVTNNIMSEYVQTTVFGQSSRLQTENMNDGSPNRYAKAWTNIIATEASHANFGDNDVFCKLVPFWQLELYFGKVLGMTPLKQSDKGGFYPNVYEYIRENADLSTAGEQQTEFVYICSLKSGMNLLDFFTKWGFLTPVDVSIDDYGSGQLTVTQSRINDIISRVKALNLPKPDVTLEYITDNTVGLYKTKPAVVSGTATRNGKVLQMANWQNVVAYEVVNAASKKVFISDGVLTPSSIVSFIINVP